MKTPALAFLFLCLLDLPGFSAAETATATLVAGHAGQIHRLETQNPSAKAQSFAQALPNINAIAEGPDGFLYVTTGAPTQPGSIVRIDPANGIPTGTFWDGSTTPGVVAKRLTGIAFQNDICYVAEADAGRIHTVDATTGAWIGVVAESAGAVISQISVNENRLLAADFNGQKIIRFSSAAGGQFGPAELLHSTAPAAPWALLEDRQGRLFYSTNADEIICLENGVAKPWITGEKARQVIYLGLSRNGDSLLLPSNATSWMSAWSVKKPETLVWEKQFAATDGIIAALEPVTSPDSVVESVNLKQSGKPGENPTAGILIRVTSKTGRITHLGWDTEGGGREINNLLRAPVEFSIQQNGQNSPLLLEGIRVSETAITGSLMRAKGEKVGGFEIALQEGHPRISASLSNAENAQILITMKLNPRMCATSFHASRWTSTDTGKLPGIFIAPDMGSMEVTSSEPAEVRFTGDRPRRETTLTFFSAANTAPKLALQFAPLHLKNPTPGTSDELWQKARRGWWNLPLATSHWGGASDGTAGSLAGIWGNNVISNPVGATLFWLADHIVLVPEWSKSVDGSDFLRHTVEYHLTHKILPGGEVAYVDQQGGAMDANPALIIAFWGVVESTGDLEWMKTWLPKLAPAIAYLNSRDVDDDGLIESKQSGNSGTGAFGDTAWDTYSSGHKNAYVNALAHRAYKCLEALSLKIADAKSAADYGQRAAKLKSVFRSTFYNLETGWIAWWKSADGELHDVHSDVPTSLATVCGLLEPADAKVMLDKYWTALKKSGFDNFALGVPLNYRPVPAAWQFTTWGGSKPDGSETFQKYLNGACTVSNTLWFLTANYITGDTVRADGILEKMVERQHTGVFPNGGGFQNGVVDIYPHGSEFLDWKGNTCGYEGHLVYSWTFLQAIPLRDPAVREKMFGFLRQPAKP